jgi:hypothetical protein
MPQTTVDTERAIDAQTTLTDRASLKEVDNLQREASQSCKTPNDVQRATTGQTTVFLERAEMRNTNHPY